MAFHNPPRCQICRCADQALEASATELDNHFYKHGFNPTPDIATPGQWMWKWMCADHQAWTSSLTHRGHVEKRVRQIEHLSGVDAFASDPEARVWMDLALRAWKEGLPRSVEFKISCDWELGDEMPTNDEMLIIDRRLRQNANMEIRAGIVAALQDRFNHAAPVDGTRLIQLICVSWGWLPEPGPETGFLDKDNYRMGHISAIWQCNALRMLHDRVGSLSFPDRRPLLGWIAAALLPGAFYSPQLAAPDIHRLIIDADCWPNDPRLPWLAKAWEKHPGALASRLAQVVLADRARDVQGSSSSDQSAANRRL